MVKLFRKRYIAIRTSIRGVSGREILKAIMNSLPSDFERSGLRLLEFNRSSGLGILWCKHRLLNAVKKAISSVREVGGDPATIKAIGVSGTVRKLRSKFLRE